MVAVCPASDQVVPDGPRFLLFGTQIRGIRGQCDPHPLQRPYQNFAGALILCLHTFVNRGKKKRGSIQNQVNKPDKSEDSASLNILILEDVETDAELIRRELRRAGLNFSAICTASRNEFEKAVAELNLDLILADYSLPDFDGNSALAIARTKCAEVPFVFVSGAIGEERAIEAMKQGATDYVLKHHLSRLVPSVRRALAEAREKSARRQAEGALQVANRKLEQRLQEITELKARLERENVYLQEEIQTEHNFQDIVGDSRPLRKLLTLLQKVAPTDSSVLITGETGTGKELFARAVHNLSRRKERPLIKVNCAALAPGVIESELFGHEKGAFTGAIGRKIGRFELAHQGTLFLDEIGDLPPEIQAKLLRVLQEQEIERVGASTAISVDVRLIAATNQNLTAEVDARNFRPDLFYRLNVFPIEIPPLRQRKEDIPPLVHHFVAKYSKRMGRQVKTVSRTTMSRLIAYPWPGNVRELENVIERSVILSAGTALQIEEDVFLPSPDSSDSAGIRTLEEVEKEHICKVLRGTGWVIEGPAGAARILGLHPSTLRGRMNKFGITRERDFRL